LEIIPIRIYQNILGVLDDEKLVYPAYEKFAKAGLKNVCIHKGLFPPSIEK
jgi:hypothetical protein